MQERSYNPRVIASSDWGALESEIRRLGCSTASTRAATRETTALALKLEGLPPEAVEELRSCVADCGGAMVADAQATGNLILSGSEASLEALGTELTKHDRPQLARAITETVRKYRRTTFRMEHARGALALGERLAVMGILNVTPDSFSDGGQFIVKDQAIEHAVQMAEDGADLIDIGGESTRPGAEDVGIDAELKRVIPVIEALVPEIGVPLSIDTTKAEVAEAALDAGASILNDVSAFRMDPRLARVAAERGAPIILMHMKGTPRTMQKDPTYDDLLSEICAYLRESIQIGLEAGIDEEKIIIDPGIGFGKTVQHNLEIIDRLPELKSLGRPILLGPSRKSFIGAVLDRPVEQRLTGTLATVALAAARGVHLIRVHDVPQAIEAARMAEAAVGRATR